MPTNGVQADAEGVGDLAVTQTLGDELDHAALTRREVELRPVRRHGRHGDAQEMASNPDLSRAPRADVRPTQHDWRVRGGGKRNSVAVADYSLDAEALEKCAEFGRKALWFGRDMVGRGRHQSNGSRLHAWLQYGDTPVA